MALKIENGILLYSSQYGDYELRREIGNGRFSTVSEAILKPGAASSSLSSASRKRHDSALSPPATPIRTSMEAPSHTYAIKRPLDKASSKVCRDEARILTQLLSLDGHERYTITFHGLDTRTNALVLDLMPWSLDGFIKSQLNDLNLERRTKLVAESFHHLASYLLNGLKWLHSQGVTHGDIKPGNILLRPSDDQSLPPSFRFDPVFSDFSSAVVSDERPSSPREAPVAGGTWDFMYYGHITSSRESREVLSDYYGLMMTLLYYVIGDSAYRSIPNRWLQMDARKQGRPLDFVMRDPELARRFEALQALEGFQYIGSGFEKAFKGDWEAVLG